MLLQRFRDWSAEGVQVEASALGNKGLGFLQRIGVPVISQAVQLGDCPSLDRLIGAIQVQIEAFKEHKVDKVYLCYTRFVNAMKQIPVIEQLLPLTDEHLSADELSANSRGTTSTSLTPKPFSTSCFAATSRL